MHTKLRLTLILAGLALAAALAGCNSKKSEAEDKVIRVTDNIGGREGFRLHWEAWKKGFETKNPGWKMELVDLGNTNAQEWFKSRIATNDLPEVIAVFDLTKSLVDAEQLQPLPMEYYTKFGIEPPEPYKGKCYTSQGGIQIVGIAVNKKMWADIGVTEPPATWDAFIAGLKALKAKGYKPLVFGGREWSASVPLNYAIQMNMYDYKPDPTKPNWTQRRDKGEVKFVTDPLARKIVENMIYFVDNFVEKGALSDGYNEEQRDFYQGKAATWIMGCWIGGEVEPLKVDFDIEYWPIPSMVGNAPKFVCSTSRPTGLAITQKAQGEKFQKALAVLEEFYEPTSYQIFLNGQAQFNTATKVPLEKPKSPWAPAQHLFDSMWANYQKFGSTPGSHISIENWPPQIMEASTQEKVMQEILAGTRDMDKLLGMMDEDWDDARKTK